MTVDQIWFIDLHHNLPVEHFLTSFTILQLILKLHHKDLDHHCRALNKT